MDSSQPRRRDRLSLVPLHRANAHLVALLRRVQGDDPLAPVTVAGPSNYANLSLRHALGRTGFANVHFMVVPRLAELLGAPALAAQGKRPLTGPLESAAVRTVAEQAHFPLDGLRQHPTLHRSLRATFRDLQRSSPEAVARVAAGDALHAEAVRLYRRWADLTKDFYDREDLAWSAARAVEQGASAALHDLGIVVFHLPGSLSPGERALAAALMRRAECHAVLGLTGDAQADEGVLELASALDGNVTAPPEAAAPLISTHILIAPDPREEVTWVLRQVMRAAGQGIPLHRMAVLYRQTQPYARLVREQCELAGIPVAGPGVTTLGETAAGRTLTGLLALASSGFEREAIMERLTACPVMPPDGRRHGFHPSHWDALSRAAGIVGGVDQWRERLERYASEMERAADAPDVRERRSEAALERMRREAREALTLAGFVERLVSDLGVPPQGAAWHTYTEWALGLLDHYLDTNSSLPPEELDAYDRVKEALRELPGVAQVRPAADFDGFRAAVEELLAAPSGHRGRTGEGLFVAPFAVAQGMEFAAVYLVGMVEGAVPPRTADDPLLPDWARRRASDTAEVIPQRGTRARDERYAYLAALESASSRTLSFPKGDPASHRKQFPSRWLLEQASVLENERVFSSGLERLGPRPWLTQLASRQEGLRAAAAAPADFHDHDLHRLLAWREAGRSIDAHYLSAGHIGRAVTMRRDRALATLSPWDGDASVLASTSQRLRPAGTQVMSPSRLQTWAKCPFSYFLSSILGIAALETPEETEVITALDKGTLVHGVLEQFLFEAIERGAPQPGQEWSPTDRARLRALAQEAFKDVEARGLTGRPLLWELEREGILDDLDQFLRQDSLMRAEFGCTPWRVEMAFGFEAEGPALDGADGGVTLVFRGMIDRVDRTADGGALVLDYKTGGSYGYRGLDNDPVDRGRLLQLPVYGMAVQQALGGELPVRAAYWFVTAKGGFARRPSQPLALETGMPPFQDAVRVIASGIASGHFPANPGPGNENCKFCDYERLCPGRRETAWERKRRDPRLASYVTLIRAGGAEEAGQ